MDAIPIIDIAPLLSHDRAATAAIARSIGAACRETGFFYIIGHGVPAQLRAQAFAASRAYFALPAAQKEAAAFTQARSNRGYIRLGAETLDPGKPPDMKEAFNIGLELAPDDPDLTNAAAFRGPNVWPATAGFRDTMLDYFDRLWRLGVDIHRAFALDLGLEENFFADKFRKPMATLRLLHYPPAPASNTSGQLGAGVHTDYGNLTLLATDDVGGLMVRSRAGEWLAAPVVPDAFVCNIGDCLMRWSNDVYVSTPHFVRNSADRDRYSIAFFLDLDPDAIVACLPACAGPQGEVRYPPVTAAEFLLSRLAPTYAATT